MKNVLKTASPFLLGLIIVTNFVVVSPISIGFSIPRTVVIMKLNNDHTVDIAINQLKEEFPSSIIIDYNSLEGFFFTFSPIGALIFVGHGTNKGVKVTDNKLLEWSDYADTVQKYNAKAVYLLNCHSNRVRPYITDQTKNKNIVTFSDRIDATIGTLLTSMLVHTSLNHKEKVYDNINKIGKRLDDLQAGKAQCHPLGKLYQKEIAYWLTELIITVLMTIVFTALGAFLKYLGKQLWGKISGKFLVKAAGAAASRLSAIKSSIIAFKLGHVTAASVLYAVGRLFTWSPSRLIAAICESMSWVDWLIWGAAFAAGIIVSIVASVVTSGANWAVTLGLLAGDLLRIACGLYVDFDSGSTPHYSLGVLTRNIFEDTVWPILRGWLSFLV
jgi:hypothetical protein